MQNQRYSQLTQIGAGGMGTVYRAHDNQTDTPVAIKHLRADAVKVNPDILERFKREGEALRQLNHPNIVKMLDAFAEDGEHYLVMEYVDGSDLADVIQAETLNLKQTLNIAIDMADALTRAHRLNIIHRDIKPANILIGEDSTVRLTDFGIAHIGSKSDITEQSMIIGTLAYLSPEACNGKELDARTDVWSFGVVLYEMLTGQRPFKGENVGTIVANILTQAIPDLENSTTDIPIELVDLMYRMLAKDLQMRVPSVRIVGAELEAILQEADIPQTGSMKTTQPDIDTVIVSTEHKPAENRFATTSSTTQITHNLPAETSSFIGRSAELTEIKRFLDAQHNRLVSIVAPGGMGKTRLAIEYARHNIETYPDGVYLVELAPLDSVESILPALANTLNIKLSEHAPPLSQILQDMGDKQSLIIMDNFEHIIDGATLIQEILTGTPHVKIIATSREKLNLSSETVFQLAGMDFPNWETPEDALEYAAVRLFMQSARRILPTFELHPDDLIYIARICRLVQGMPLGILLAASWVEMLTSEEIAQELEANVDFLESEMRDLPERHRSIHAVFEYSWNLIGEKERDVLAALSIFRGGFTREAAQRITNATLRTLTMLVNKSFLTRDPTSGRYIIHELLRQYAYIELQKYSNEDNVRQAHAEYYMNILNFSINDSILLDAQKMSEIFNAEVQNLHLAWEWAVSTRMETIITQSLNGLEYFCFGLGKAITTGRWLEYARQKWDIYNRDMSTLNRVERMVMIRQIFQLKKDSIERYEFAISQARAENDLAELAYALLIIGIIRTYGETYTSQLPEGIAALEESIEISRKIQTSTALAQLYLHRAYIVDGNLKLAHENIERELVETDSDIIFWSLKLGIGLLLSVEAYVSQTYIDQAFVILPELLAHYQQVKNYDSCVDVNIFLFDIYMLRQDIDKATDCLKTIEKYAEHIPEPWRSANSKILNAILALYQHEFEIAYHLAQQAFELLKESGSIARYVLSILNLIRGETNSAQTALQNLLQYATRNPARIKNGQILSISMDIEPSDAPLYAKALPQIFAELARQLGELELSAQIVGKYLQTPIDVKYWVEDLPIFAELPAKLQSEMGDEKYQSALEASQSADLGQLYTQLLG